MLEPESSTEIVGQKVFFVLLGFVFLGFFLFFWKFRIMGIAEAGQKGRRSAGADSAAH